MSDHIVVFDGNPRLVGNIVALEIVEATSFTLFGAVVTDQRLGVCQIGVDHGEQNTDSMDKQENAAWPRRIGLPVI